MRNRRNHAFTLVELLVVIGIIAILIAVLLPALAAARRQAAAIKCAASLRSIGQCFKLYEIDSKGFWPVARINGWKPSPTAAGQYYNIDGLDFPLNGDPPGTTISGSQGHWFVFLQKYATKAMVGNAANKLDLVNAEQSRKTIFFGCPAWEGYKTGGVTLGDTNLVQTGYGMNPYAAPAFEALPLTTGQSPDVNPTTKVNNPIDYAVIDLNDNPTGNFLKAKNWTHPTERMLVADSRFWLATSGTAPVIAAGYPPAVVAQPIIDNSSNGSPGVTQSYIDMYRHGKTPNKISASQLDPAGGKIAYNILYCDGHVSTQSDGKEAYRSARMRFPR